MENFKRDIVKKSGTDLNPAVVKGGGGENIFWFFFHFFALTFYAVPTGNEQGQFAPDPHHRRRRGRYRSGLCAAIRQSRTHGNPSDPVSGWTADADAENDGATAYYLKPYIRYGWKNIDGKFFPVIPTCGLT